MYAIALKFVQPRQYLVAVVRQHHRWTTGTETCLKFQTMTEAVAWMVDNGIQDCEAVPV